MKLKCDWLAPKPRVSKGNVQVVEGNWKQLILLFVW